MIDLEWLKQSKQTSRIIINIGISLSFKYRFNYHIYSKIQRAIVSNNLNEEFIELITSNTKNKNYFIY